MMASRSQATYPPPSEVRGKRLRMSYEEYLAWSDEDVFAEWKEGEVIVHMPVKDRHQRVIVLLSTVINLFIDFYHLGVLRLGPEEVRLGPRGPSREPDLFFVATEHLHQLTDDRFEGAPDLIVEVVSGDSVTRDYDTKRREYQAAGVREYWIIDPRPRRQESLYYRLDDQGQYRLVEPEDNAIIRSQVVPGFWWRISWLWEDPAPSPLSVLATLLGRAPIEPPER